MINDFLRYLKLLDFRKRMERHQDSGLYLVSGYISGYFITSDSWDEMGRWTHRCFSENEGSK